jgi:dienelactone hydrolase
MARRRQALTVAALVISAIALSACSVSFVGPSITYPGAHHSFDSHNPVRYVEARNNPSSPTGRGATTGGDPVAWADSIREVAAFFGRHLK